MVLFASLSARSSMTGSSRLKDFTSSFRVLISYKCTHKNCHQMYSVCIMYVTMRFGLLKLYNKTYNIVGRFKSDVTALVRCIVLLSLLKSTRLLTEITHKKANTSMRISELHNLRSYISNVLQCNSPVLGCLGILK